MRRADMFRIVDKLTGAESHQKVHQERLNKLLEVFKDKRLVSSLNIGSEKCAYEKYIAPLIKGEKEMEDITAIFFVALLAIYDQNEYQINTVKNKDRMTIEADDWISDVNENIEKAKEVLEDVELIKYRDKKDKELKKLQKIQDKILRDRKIRNLNKKYDEKGFFVVRKINWKKNESAITNLLSVCAKIDLNYFLKDFEHEEKLNYILKQVEYLPVDLKREFLNRNKNQIDELHEAILQVVEGIYNDYKKAKQEGDLEKVGDAFARKSEYEMLSGKIR